MTRKVTIIGGGLGGLILAIRLARANIPCLVVEKKSYPFHRVCGEYISNECLNFLQDEHLYPKQFDPPNISRFQLSSVSGKDCITPLDLGGFGISRYAYDNYLYEIATSVGVEFMLNTEVTNVVSTKPGFKLYTGTQEFDAELVVGSFGKRSRVDIATARNFIQKRSPYIGVKYHLRINHPNDLIALHNFEGGYCGLSNVENGVTNLCYLAHRSVLRKHKTISAMEQEVLWKNPHLRKVFNEADFLFKDPVTINEISFETKEPVWNDMFLVGDAAGMIAPLCGNGMAMAIHSAKLLSDILMEHLLRENAVEFVPQHYERVWRQTFARRLRFGRIVQNYLFGRAWSSALAISVALNSRPITRHIIRNTHGQPF